MTAPALSVVAVILLPLAVVWIAVLVDIVRSRHLGRGAKAAWIVLCTLVWPTLILYLMGRPAVGRVEEEQQRTDRRARLIDAVLDREAARISDEEWRAVEADLRTR